MQNNELSSKQSQVEFLLLQRGLLENENYVLKKALHHALKVANYFAKTDMSSLNVDPKLHDGFFEDSEKYERALNGEDEKF